MIPSQYNAQPSYGASSQMEQHNDENVQLDSQDLKYGYVRAATCIPNTRSFGRDLSNLPCQNGGSEINKAKSNERQMELDSDMGGPTPCPNSCNISYGQLSTNNSSIEEGAHRPLTAQPVKNKFELPQPSQRPAANPDPQACSEYVGQIFNQLRQEERFFHPSRHYMCQQTQITDKMRAILVDWLVDVHLKFKMKSETLFITVNIIDRYLEREQASTQNLQLVGVAALLIAAKYEEIYPPELPQFLSVADHTYNKSELLQMEQSIIQTLDFNFNVASPKLFGEHYLRVLALDFKKVDKKLQTFMDYMLELSLLDLDLYEFLPSTLAAGALYLGIKLNQYSEDIGAVQGGIEAMLCQKLQFPLGAISQCAKILYEKLQQCHNSNYQATHRKFHGRIGAKNEGSNMTSNYSYQYQQTPQWTNPSSVNSSAQQSVCSHSDQYNQIQLAQQMNMQQQWAGQGAAMGQMYQQQFPQNQQVQSVYHQQNQQMRQSVGSFHGYYPTGSYSYSQ